MMGARGRFRKTNRSAFANFLHSKYEMYTGEVCAQAYPYYLTLEASDKCQLRCPTCVTGIENELRAKGDRSTIFRHNRTALKHELFDSLLAELGDYLYLIVFYNFGEPLLHKDLPALIRKAKARHIEIDVNTNLSLPLSDARIEELLTSGLDYIYASVDGFSQRTYEIHRKRGDLELVKRNLEKLAKKRDQLALDTCITLNFLVFSFNEHEIPAAQRFCADLRIQFNRRDAFIHDPTWLPSYRRKEKPQIVPDEISLPEGYRHTVDGASVAWSPLPETKEIKLGRCAWHYGYTAISAGGKVSPCCAVPGEKNDFGAMAPGHARFADVWNNERYRRSRADFAGRAAGELADTVCTHCPVPKFVHHMYSLHDYKVIAQAARVLAPADPLVRGFDLFSRARYGQSIKELFPGNAFKQPKNFFGLESERDVAEFVAYYRANLMPQFIPAVAQSRSTREANRKELV
jgi:MoaA/NifB/PqqE/SkfB family radical SAM enzyme